MIDRAFVLLAVAAAALMVVSAVPAGEAPKKPASVHDFTVEDIDGKPVALSKYEGKVLLIVNTASQCGNTPQYQGMETLFEKYQAQGFEVLAFPANEFGKQEPGTNSEIKTFCTSKYNVAFPLFSKIVVQGKDIHPLYRHLTSAETDPKFAGPIGWNFAKFLVDRKGQVVARFEPGEQPESDKVVKALESALAASK